MSLGFNTHRRPRVTNLPGSVGASVIIQTRRVPSSSSPTTASLLSTLKKKSSRDAEHHARREGAGGAEEGAGGAGGARGAGGAGGGTRLKGTGDQAGRAGEAFSKASPRQTIVERDDESSSQQWVFATVAGHDMVDEMDTDSVVARTGERVMLVYPMRSDSNTGRVTMRAKTVDAVTGQLSYTWVLVYDPESGTRAVTDFALC